MKIFYTSSNLPIIHRIISLLFFIVYFMPKLAFSAAMPLPGEKLYVFLKNYPAEQNCLEYIRKNPLSEQEVHYTHSISGSTSLMQAAGLGYSKLFQTLLAKKALLNVVDKNGIAVLGYATSKLSLAEADKSYAQQTVATHEIIDLILGDPSINLEIADKYGNTPLIAAAKSNHFSLVKKLVMAGANKQALNYYNETALVAAERKGYKDIVTYLEQASRKKPQRSAELIFQSSDSSD